MTITSTVGYTGHPFDESTGLTYMQARYYDPVLGRFYGVDPVGFVESNPMSFNRYAYGNNSPYRYVDPDGQIPIDWAVDGISIGISAGLFARDPSVGNAIGLAVDVVLGIIPYAPSGVGILRTGGKALDAGKAAKGGAETVQRAMSRAELEAIQKSGTLSRGGRSGPHHVSDAVNSNANRARQRLSLPQTPEVRATLEVPKGVFSSPTKVKPDFNMPGGGLERTAPGSLDIPAKIIRVDGL